MSTACEHLAFYMEHHSLAYTNHSVTCICFLSKVLPKRIQTHRHITLKLFVKIWLIIKVQPSLNCHWHYWPNWHKYYQCHEEKYTKLFFNYHGRRIKKKIPAKCFDQVSPNELFQVA